MKTSKGFPFVTCNNCNWVSFGVSKKYAKEEVNRFNEFFDKLSKSDQQLFYGGEKSKLENYTCLRCGGNNFRLAKDGDCPDGCTLNPVIYGGDKNEK